MAVTWEHLLNSYIRKKDKKQKLTLRVTNNRKSKYFDVLHNSKKVYLTQKEFKNINKSELNQFIIDQSNRVNEIIDEIQTFSFPAFEKRYQIGINIKSAFETKINEIIEAADKKKDGSYSTADSYKGALKKFIEFRGDISLISINEAYIKDFIDFCDNYPITYLKYLRHVCKRSGNEVFSNIKISSNPKMKFPLQMDDLKKVLTYTTEYDVRQKHVDFWKMIYYGGGMNLKDWFYLRETQVFDTHIIKLRGKTETPIMISLTKPLQELMDYHRSGTNFYFGFISDMMSNEEKYRRYKTFKSNLQRSLNHVKKELDIKVNFTSYTGRYTHANVLRNNGAADSDIQDSLGQKDPRSVRTYMGNLYDENRINLAKKLHVLGND